MEQIRDNIHTGQDNKRFSIRPLDYLLKGQLIVAGNHERRHLSGV